MNIFVLGNTPQESASYAVDAHLNKQVLEIFQMLAVRYPNQLPKKDGSMYGISHENHPLTKWVCASVANASFAFNYAVSFITETANRKRVNLTASYPVSVADALLTVDSTIEGTKAYKPLSYPLYIPEYIRAKLLPGYELGDTPKTTPDLDVAVKGYRLYYVLEKYRSMDKFEWGGSAKIPEWYLDMCVKLGRSPF